MYLITPNKIILKVCEPKYKTLHQNQRQIYVVWWRSRVVNWPALLKVKLPKRLYATRHHRKRKIFLYKLNFSGNNSVFYDHIENKDFLLKTENAEDVLEWICQNDFPQEIIDHFIAKI